MTDGRGTDTSDATPPVVRLEGITKRFDDVVACRDVDFELRPGTVHGLVGENGAGKTTLMNVLYGLYEADAGTVAVNGEPVDFESPRDAIDAGIGMIHQHFMLVGRMTVLQNIVLGHEPTSRGLVDRQTAREEITAISDRFGFDVAKHLDDPVEDLGVGERQRVEICKALYRGADILILDEPTAVLTPQEVEVLYEVMAELVADGHSIIFITHKLDEALRAADAITVLRDGENVGTVAAADTTKADLARMMVGRDVLFTVESREGDPGAEIFSVRDLVVEDDRGLRQVEGVSFTVREGEVFGIAGVEGNGQRELVEAITGLRTPTAGSISFDGEDVTQTSRRDRIEAGMSYIPEDRHEEGLVLDYELTQNGLLGNQTLRPFRSNWFLNWPHINTHADEIVDTYNIEPTEPRSAAKDFSGGNQQKFIVGREFERNPTLIVAAHPTRGVDVGSIEFVHKRLLEMRDEGTAVVLVSSKLDEVHKLSDRMAVMYEGRFVDVVNPEDVSTEEIGMLMAGGEETAHSTTTADERAQPETAGGDS